MKILCNVLLFSVIILLISCTRDEDFNYPYPCINRNCNSNFEIDSKVSPGVLKDNNSYYHIKYNGLEYFTIKGKLSELNPKYIINGVPLIETQYDSNYWVIFDTIRFKVPIYSILSWFTNKDYKNNLISIGNKEYSLIDIAKTQPPFNITGYQIGRNFCIECPYAKTLLGGYSKYNYNPSHQFFLNKNMKGDTLKVIIKVLYNTDIGRKIEEDKEFNIIVD